MKAHSSYNSLVKEANIYHIDDYLNKEEADEIFNLLYDKDKLRFQTTYYYNDNEKEIVESNNHRKSYWLGEYAQATQTTNNWKVDEDTGDKILVPTDYVMPFEFPPLVQKLKERIETEFDVKFNSCLVGLFDFSGSKIGYHSDASDAMGPDPQIASLSFGRPRLFKMKKNRKYITDGDNEMTEMILNHGALVIMKDGANEKYLHAVMKDSGCNEENVRLNLTFRNYDYHEDEMKIQAKPF